MFQLPVSPLKKLAPQSDIPFRQTALAIFALIGLANLPASATERIVFASNDKGQYDICSTTPDGLNFRHLTNDLAVDANPSISPNGGKVVYRSDRDARGGSSSRSGIFIWDFYTKKIDSLTPDDSSSDNPSFSPDGKRIVYSTFVPGSPVGGFRIATMDLDGGNKTILTGPPADPGATSSDEQPQFSPDGKSIIFARGVGASSNAAAHEDLMLIPAQGGDAVKLTDNTDTMRRDYSPSFSPDGKTVVFQSVVPGTTETPTGDQLDLFAIGSDGVGRHQLTFTDSFETKPSFDPTGTKILFSGFDSDAGEVNLYVMDYVPSSETPKPPGEDGRVELTGNIEGSQSAGFWGNLIDGSASVSASLTPTNPNTNAVLTAKAVFNNFATPPTLNYDWYIGRDLKQTGSSNTFDLSKAGNGDAGQLVGVVVTATSPEISSVGSTSVLIQNSLPANGAVTPSGLSSAPGVNRIFKAVYRDADGGGDITDARLLINSSLVASGSLTGRYMGGKLYLASDDGKTFLGGFAPGSANLISNGQGTLDCSKTSVDAASDGLTIKWSFTPSESFLGTKSLYLLCIDKFKAQDGWDSAATWTIASGSLPPENVSVTPNSGSSPAGVRRNVTSTYRDGNGAGDIVEARILIAPALQSANNLTGRFYGGRLYLSSDSGKGFDGGYLPGSNNYIVNSAGYLDCSKTTVSYAGDTLTIHWSFVPAASLKGLNLIYGLVTDRARNQDGWDKLGALTVTTAEPATATADPAVRPSGNSG